MIRATDRSTTKVIPAVITEQTAIATARKPSQVRHLRNTCLTVLAAGLSLAATGAYAACGDPRNSTGSMHVHLPQQTESSEWHGDSIVGVWKVTFTSAEVPQFNHESLDVWHSDQTEFESADLPPITGAVCVGAYQNTGPMTLQLNHFGFTWDMTGLTPTGSFNLIEKVTLSPGGNKYTGTFDFRPYDVNGNFEPDGEVKGVMVGTRITAD